jgi:hypothetical protein
MLKVEDEMKMNNREVQNETELKMRKMEIKKEKQTKSELIRFKVFSSILPILEYYLFSAYPE